MKKWNVAVYLRLSSDDGDKSESNSIGNQRNIIKQYIKNNNLNVNVNYYTDDGYSGTTFERPDFQKMLKDIKDNKINCIIVKDLSRLGRNYIEVGKYIDEIFPSYNIRFIAINDNIDSYKDPKSTSSVIVPFKNLMNDEYARDISQKVRSVLDSKKANGQFIGSYAPYGYLRNPKDKYKFIVDKEAEKVVKKIFNMILSGKSKKETVDELNNLGIATPRIYKMESQNFKYNTTETTKKWNAKKVDEILKNRTYTGDLIQGVRKKISHKIHKNQRVRESEWIVIPNHHKAIISKEQFEQVQEILYERCIRVNKNDKYDTLVGHIRCNECGNGFTIKSAKGHDYYYCSSYLRKKNCTSHSYKKEELESNIIKIINNFREVVKDIDEKITLILEQKEICYDVEILKAKIETNENQKNKYIMLRDSVKNDFKENLITEDEYWEYSDEYSKKIKELKQEKIKLEKKLEQISFKSLDNIAWLEEVKKLKEVKVLDKLLIDELIEDIVIDENRNIKVIFKCEDKYFEALDFIKRQNYDIISSS